MLAIYDLDHPEAIPRTISVAEQLPPGVHFDAMIWSPDGRQILFETTNCEYPCTAPGSALQLHTIDLATGAVQVVSQSLPPGLVVSWAPDGKTLGFRDGLIVDLHGTTVRDLLPAVSNAASAAPMTCWSGPIWSPDGSRIAIIDPLPHDAGRLLVFDPGADQPRVLAASACAIIGWSPDGARIVYRTGDPFAERWVQEGDSGGLRPAGAGSDAWIISVNGGAPQGLKHLDWGQVPILTWSPAAGPDR
jgi:Tol biopolymer transport system component